MNSKYLVRKQLLDEIIVDLEIHKKSGQCENSYALEANLNFFRSLYRFRDFWHWFRKVRPTLDGKRLLELSDFHLSNGKWERMLQKELLEIEKWKFPDVLGRIRKEILKQIAELNQPGRHLILVSIGSGSMEIERQLIIKLREKGNNQKIIFFGIDNSNTSLDIANENLVDLKIKLFRISNLDQGKVNQLKQEFQNEQYTVVLINGDAVKLETYFGQKNIDLAYHSKFKHHLPDNLKIKLDRMIEIVAKRGIENDDLNCWIINLGSIKANWKNRPVLLNGALLSFLRDPSKEELRSNNTPGWQTKIYMDGYLRIYH
ncbi:MAG TPA: hypothetical protein VJB69_02705 [Candidatus Paceibacterota bacterium]